MATGSGCRIFPSLPSALAGNEIPTNLFGTPPKEMLWEEPVKVGPSAEPGTPVTFREEAPTAKPLGRRPNGSEKAGASVFAGVLVLIALGGGAAAWWFDQWPFDIRGPLRQYARGADGYIYADPDFVAAETAEDGKDYAGLLKDAKQLVSDYPDSSLAHYILGVAYGKMHFFGDAAGSFQAGDQTEAGLHRCVEQSRLGVHGIGETCRGSRPCSSN